MYGIHIHLVLIFHSGASRGRETITAVESSHTTLSHDIIVGLCGPSHFKNAKKIANGRLGSVWDGSARLGSARLGSARLGSARLGPARLGSVRVGSGWLGSARVDSGRFGSARVGSGRLGSGRIGSGRLGSGLVGLELIPIGPGWIGSGRTPPHYNPYPHPKPAEKLGNIVRDLKIHHIHFVVALADDV